MAGGDGDGDGDGKTPPSGNIHMRGAFFRCLNGSRRISLSDLRFFMPSLTAEELLLPDFWS